MISALVNKIFHARQSDPPSFATLVLQVNRRFATRLHLLRCALRREEDIPGFIRKAIDRAARRVCKRAGVDQSGAERARLIYAVLDEALGFGPFETLLRDPTTQRIIIHGPETIHVEGTNGRRRATVGFRDMAHLKAMIDRMLESGCCVADGPMPALDGEDVNLVIRRSSSSGGCLELSASTSA